MIRRMKVLLPLCAGTAVLVAASLPAAAAVGDWAEGDRVRVRLVAAGADADGHLDAAIEVELAPGWKTYWRSPGDAGIAPRIDFTASANIDGPVVRFPVPERHDDGYAVTNIFEGRVVFPVDAAITDPATPVDLRLALDIGVCDEICIPVHIETWLAVPAAAPDAAAAGIIAAAKARLPGAPEPGVLAVAGVSRNGGTERNPVFDVSALVPDPEDVTVFVEGPADWSADVPRLASSDGGRAVYSVSFSRLGAETPIEGAEFRVTIVSGGRAVEQIIGLDEPR